MLKHCFAWLVCGLLACPRIALTADEPIVQGRVVGKVWHARMQMSDSFKFMKSVQEAMGLDEGPMVMMMPRAARHLGTTSFGFRSDGDEQARPEVKGTLIFLQTAPVPDLSSSIGFEYVGDIETFRKRLEEHVSQIGPNAELIGADDRYEVKISLQPMVAAQPAPPADGEEPGETRTVRTFAITITADSGSLKEGELPKPPTSFSTWYRYLDGFMYTSRNSSVHSVELPTKEDLRLDEEHAQNDLYADFDLREIPLELKRAFWNALETSASTWLQRFDNEAIGEYSLRKSLGEGRLELIRAGLFDVERVRLSIRLPEADEPQVKAQLRVTARDGSQLGQTLTELSRQPTQLAALRTDDAPFVFSSALRMPEWTGPAMTMFVESLRLRLREAAGEDEGLGVLIDDLMKPLAEAASSREFDAAVSMRGTPETGMVLQSGIRLPDAEQFLSALEVAVNVLHSERFHATPVDINGISGLTIQSDNPVSVTGELSVPVQIHLAATGSWLWLTMGGETSLAALRDLVSASEERLASRAKGTPLQVRFRLSQWLADSDDEFSGVPREALKSLEQWLGEVTRPRMTFSMQVNGKAVEVGNPQDHEFTSYAKKLLTPENADLELTVTTSGRELQCDASVGTGVVHFAAAQYVAAQASMFRNMPIMISPGAGGKTQSIRIGR